MNSEPGDSAERFEKNDRHFRYKKCYGVTYAVHDGQDIIDIKDNGRNVISMMCNYFGDTTVSGSCDLKLLAAKVNNLNLSTVLSPVDLYYDTIDNASIYSKRNRFPVEMDMRIDHCLINRGLIREVDFNQLSITESQMTERMIISRCRFPDVGRLSITNSHLPDTLILVDIVMNKGGEIVLNSYKNSPGDICHLMLRAIDLSLLDFEYSNFKLFFHKNDPQELRRGTYQSLLNNFQKRGYYKSFENLDKEFKSFKYYNDYPFAIGSVLDFIDSFWWDYGYNKFLILRSSAILTICFFVINLIFFSILVREGYTLKNLVAIDAKIRQQTRERSFKRFVSRVPYAFVYTCFIFWGLRLNTEHLNVHRLSLFWYIVAQYILGVVCLAYIANLIITT